MKILLVIIIFCMGVALYQLCHSLNHVHELKAQLEQNLRLTDIRRRTEAQDAEPYKAIRH